MSERSERGPLRGVRVIDLTHFLAGPYAALTLADLGADVVKVEDPDRPDEARHVGPCFLDGESVYFLSLNWAKRSLALRLGDPAGRRALLEVIAGADVVLDNYKPGVMAKLGLAHEDLLPVNPRIISCSLSGYGATGPSRDQPGYDYTIQALSGVMSLTGEPGGPPGKAGISYVDHAGGMAAALAICASLVERQATGVGRRLDVSLLDVQVSMLTYLAGWRANAGFGPSRQAFGAHPSIVPAQTFATADGHVSIFVGNDPMWARLVRALDGGSADGARIDDDRFATSPGRYEHRVDLLAALSSMLAAGSSQRWIDALRRHHVPCAPVNSIAEALDDPQVLARQLVATAEHPSYGAYRRTRGPVPLGDEVVAGAPLLGEHTREVLAESGIDRECIDALIASGVAVQVDESRVRRLPNRRRSDI